MFFFPQREIFGEPQVSDGKKPSAADQDASDRSLLIVHLLLAAGQKK